MFQKIYKYFFIFLIAAVIFSSFVFNASAVSAESTLIISDSQPKVGGTITVTVKFSFEPAMQAILGVLKFDNTKLQYISSGGSFTSNPKGNSILFTTIGNSNLYAEEYTFKVIASGNTSISLSSTYSDGEKEYTITSSYYTLEIQDSHYSTLFGDCDGNSVINTQDLALLKLYLAGQIPENFDEEAADIDCDSFIKTSDLAMMKINLTNS